MRATTIETKGAQARIITPNDGYHYFFGYYDLQPFDSTGRYHLVHRVTFADRLQKPDDVCELGAIDLQTGEFVKYAETTAWCFQQGTLLQWYKDDNHIIYNARLEDGYHACIQDIRTGEKRYLPRAFTNISADGTKALAVNMARIFDFRPGYGYVGIRDPFYDENAPEDDGVFVMDTETGETRMVVSYAKIRETFPCPPFSDGKLLVNHINFNPSGTRFVMLFRNFRTEKASWSTQLITCDLEGNLHKMYDFALHSHYHWKNDEELIIYSGVPNEAQVRGLYIFRDCTDEMTFLGLPTPDIPLDISNTDIHCLFSPNRRFIMGDGYETRDHYRGLHMIDAKTQEDKLIGRYAVAPFAAGEIRCDLHARFDPTGRYISFDSTHPGYRCVCIMDTAELNCYEA